MISPWIRRTLAWVAACVLLAPLVLRAQEPVPVEWPGRVGRLVDVQGAVRMLDLAENEWVPALPNRPLTSGDHLVTEAGARAELRVGSTTLRLDGQTDLEILRLDDQAVVLQLNAGSLALKVVSQELLSQLEVVTVEGTFRPRQIGHYRIDRRDDASEATSWRGELVFEGRDSTLVIPDGRRAELWLKGPAQVTHYSWTDIERDAFADWVAYDDTSAERSVSARYVSPEMTGWEDLDRYGNWQTHPEYGAVWFPVTVAAGWAPYRSGQWTWIAPWGWTWVDNARWGFAPFHYGRWVWWGRRWCWAPGHRVHRPVFAPALVAWVGGSHVSVGVRIGAPPVAWVPLGPRDPYRPHPNWRDRDDGRDERGGTRREPPGAPGRAAPTGPIVYSNQNVPGAVTAVAPDAFVNRRPVTPLPVTSDLRLPVLRVAPPAAPPLPQRTAPATLRATPPADRPVAPVPPHAPPIALPARPDLGVRPEAGATPDARTARPVAPLRPDAGTRPEPAARPEPGVRQVVPGLRGDPPARPERARPAPADVQHAPPAVRVPPAAPAPVAPTPATPPPAAAPAPHRSVTTPPPVPARAVPVPAPTPVPAPAAAPPAAPEPRAAPPAPGRTRPDSDKDNDNRPRASEQRPGARQQPQ